MYSYIHTGMLPTYELLLESCSDRSTTMNAMRDFVLCFTPWTQMELQPRKKPAVHIKTEGHPRTDIFLHNHFRFIMQLIKKVTLLSFLISWQTPLLFASTENLPSYGTDISFPHHHRQISTNYAWLPHNQDPTHHPVPSQYKDMPVQPLGDRQAFYENFLESCEKFYKEKKCLPKSAQV